MILSFDSVTNAFIQDPHLLRTSMLQAMMILVLMAHMEHAHILEHAHIRTIVLEMKEEALASGVGWGLVD